MFDAVQRAHLNFVENYPQFLGVAFFALKLAPKLATVCGTLFLLGRFAPYARWPPIPPRRASSPARAPRVVFAFGYYSGIAANKDRGAFG